MIKVLPPKTAEEVVAREKERKERTTLLMALSEDHLAKFHKMDDAKEMWKAIKSRFGGNDESKKMQKYLLKQQFEGFSASASKGSDNEVESCSKTCAESYARLKKVYDEQRDKLGDASVEITAYTLALKRIEAQLLCHQQNQLAYEQKISAPQLDCDDLEQINDDDLEEMDLKGQVTMISIRIKKFYKRTDRKLQFDTRDTVGFDKTKVECFNCHKMGHFARDCRAKWNQDSRRRDGGYNGNKARDNNRRPASHDDSKALVTIDREAVDWFGHVEEDT
nr:ribonuclease H-like domain-containing protein [Tanacetum cinerariifolium]